MVMRMSEAPLRTRTVLVRNDRQKIKGLMDVVKIARAQGQTIFKTHEHVRVIKIHGPFRDGCFAVEVEGPNCTEASGVRGRKRGEK